MLQDSQTLSVGGRANAPTDGLRETKHAPLHFQTLNSSFRAKLVIAGPRIRDVLGRAAVQAEWFRDKLFRPGHILCVGQVAPGVVQESVPSALTRLVLP